MCGADTRDSGPRKIVESPPAWPDRVAASFGRAARHYARHAHVQREIAASFFDWFEPLLAGHPVGCGLEIGCGTGYLTDKLWQRWPRADWAISDVSAEMVEHCRRSLAGPKRPPHTRFFVADGQAVQLQDNSLDLIASSLAFQWMTNLPDSVNRLMRALRPGGWLVFSTLGAGSFATVRDYLSQPFQGYPGLSDLKQQLAIHGQSGCISQQQFVDTMPGLLPFLRHLKRIGAGSVPEHRSVSVSGLRQAIRQSGDLADGLPVEYEVLQVAICKSPEPGDPVP